LQREVESTRRFHVARHLATFDGAANHGGGNLVIPANIKLLTSFPYIAKSF
jgi:hypothetical protein